MTHRTRVVARSSLAEEKEKEKLAVGSRCIEPARRTSTLDARRREWIWTSTQHTRGLV